MKPFFALAAVAAVLAGCGQQPTSKEAPAPTAAPAPKPAEPPIQATPNVGKVSVTTLTAQGVGGSISDAVAEAMKMAVVQANGAKVDAATLRVKFGMDVNTSEGAAWFRGDAFVDAVKTRSGGVIQSLKIVELKEPAAKGESYRATIEAGIAKFATPPELDRIKVAIAPVRFPAQTVVVGDRVMQSSEVAGLIRTRLVDALVSTGRFAVLERDANPAIEAELAQIENGKAPSVEEAKLAQAVSADVVWSANVTSFAYNRHARQLKTSDRQLVSYSGGWSLSQRLVNVATRQIMVSETLKGEAQPIEPTTLGATPDADKVLQEMSDDIIAQAVSSLLRRTFPISVVSRDGDAVVLSQGTGSVKEGARYQMVKLGEAMKDPQTGQLLGRTETRCCEVVIERVTPTLSYGRLEGVRVALDGAMAGAIQVREELKPSATTKVAEAPVETAPLPAASLRPVASGQPPAAEKPPAKADDKW